MSYREAQQDGVTIRRSGNGSTVYYPPCHICGKPTFSLKLHAKPQIHLRDVQGGGFDSKSRKRTA